MMRKRENLTHKRSGCGGSLWIYERNDNLEKNGWKGTWRFKGNHKRFELPVKHVFTELPH